MDQPALILAVSGASALLALVLSVTRYNVAARRFALLALWLALAVVPFALAIDLVAIWRDPDESVSRAALLGGAFSHAMRFGGLVVPCAMLSGLALRRASTRQRR